MISQIYVKSADTYILCVEKTEYRRKDIVGVVVLLPGFSQSACDVDYFMTTLANELIRLGYITIQVDIYGHGDSYGDLSELSIEIVETNILSVYKYIKMTWKDKVIFAVSRGFYGNLLSTESISNKFEKIICINPVISKINLFDLTKYIENEILELSEILSENSIMNSFFISLGADLTNIRGQKIASDFLIDIFSSINNLRQYENVVIISSYNDQNKLNRIILSEEVAFPIEYIAEHCFIRDPEWQTDLISEVSEILEEETRCECHFKLTAMEMN